MAYYCQVLWRRARALDLIVFLSRASFLRHRARLNGHGRGMSPAFGEEILMRSPICCPGFRLRCAANRHILISLWEAFVGGDLVCSTRPVVCRVPIIAVDFSTSLYSLAVFLIIPTIFLLRDCISYLRGISGTRGRGSAWHGYSVVELP